MGVNPTLNQKPRDRTKGVGGSETQKVSALPFQVVTA